MYVFALFGHRRKATADPLDLDQWTFYVVPTSLLNAVAPEQKSISLSRLEALVPAPTRFAGLAVRVEAAAADGTS